MLQMFCSHSYTLNKNVFILRLNMSSQRLMFGVQQEHCSTNAVPDATRPESADRRRRQATVDIGWQYTWRYSGAMTCWHLYARTAVLKTIHCRTGSQWRSQRIGLICSDLLAPVTRRVAAFWTTCSLCSSWLLTPASRLLQQSSQMLTKAWTIVLFASGVSDCLIDLSRRRRNRICRVPQSDCDWPWVQKSCKILYPQVIINSDADTRTLRQICG